MGLHITSTLAYSSNGTLSGVFNTLGPRKTFELLGGFFFFFLIYDLYRVEMPDQNNLIKGGQTNPVSTQYPGKQ